jgi:outer membrane receptor protein involved in Fe transport
LDYFDVLVDPVQIQVQGIDPLTGQLIYGNAQVGKQTNKGVEADVGYVIDVGTDELPLFGTFYRANPLNATGSTPSSAVKVKNTLVVKYTPGSGALKGFHFGGAVSHYGGSPGTGFPWMPAYTLYDAFFGYGSKATHWYVDVAVDNLANKKDYYIGSEGSFAAYLGEPLSFRTTIGYKW